MVAEGWGFVNPVGPDDLVRRLIRYPVITGQVTASLIRNTSVFRRFPFGTPVALNGPGSSCAGRVAPSSCLDTRRHRPKRSARRFTVRPVAHIGWGGAAMEHRFVACLYADISGYSRLIADDVKGTARRLTSYQAMILRTVARHRGRVVDLVGDSLLATFGTVAGAVQCALEVQRQIAA